MKLTFYDFMRYCEYNDEIIDILKMEKIARELKENTTYELIENNKEYMNEQ